MIKKRLLLFLVLLVILGCSEEEKSSEKITGAMVADVSLSTLVVRVVDDTGALLGNAVVLVNGKEKGKTSLYGTAKGTKRVVLDGPLNLIQVRKEGYSSTETSVSEISTGEQSLTLILEKKRTTLEVKVLAKSIPLSKVEASLYHTKRGRVAQAYLTDHNGTAKFSQLENGNYLLQLEKDDYLPRQLVVSVNYSRDGDALKKVFELSKIPRLEVTVSDTNGHGLKDVEVTLYSKEDYNLPGASPLHVRYTSTEGKVQFIPLHVNQEYVLILKKEGYRAQLQEKIITEEDQQLMVEMAPLTS